MGGEWGAPAPAPESNALKTAAPRTPTDNTLFHSPRVPCSAACSAADARHTRPRSARRRRAGGVLVDNRCLNACLLARILASSRISVIVVNAVALKYVSALSPSPRAAGNFSSVSRKVSRCALYPPRALRSPFVLHSACSTPPASTISMRPSYPPLPASSSSSSSFSLPPPRFPPSSSSDSRPAA
jgi:hypothetical protein